MKKTCRDILESSKKHGWVTEPLAKEILQMYHIKTSHYYWIKSPEEINNISSSISFPVFVKVVSPEIIHKTDCGGILSNVKNINEIDAAFEKLSSLPGFNGVVVDEEVQGVEVIFGAREDPQFGKVVLIGIGGTAVEVYRDIAIRMAPLSIDSSINAIQSLQGIEILQGFRGREPVDIEHLAEVFCNFSKMVHDMRNDFDSIDLNPVICRGSDAVVADARILLNNR